MKIIGNAFYFGKEADHADVKFGAFFSWLQDRQLTAGTLWPPHKTVNEHTAFHREFFVNTSEDLFYGVVLSGRTNKFQHYVNRVGNKVTVEAKTNEKPPVEVNCFCIRRDSNKGMYSHYYGSYAFMTFLQDLWNAYRHFVRLKQSAVVDQLTPADDADAVLKAYSLRARCAWSPLSTRENFERMVRSLKEVWEVRFTTYEIIADEDAPMRSKIKNVHNTYRMQAEDASSAGFWSWMRAKRTRATRTLKSGTQSVSGSVFGVTAEGAEKTINFGENLDNLLDFSYDDMGTFDVEKLIENPCIAAMVDKARDTPMFDAG